MNRAFAPRALFLLVILSFVLVGMPPAAAAPDAPSATYSENFDTATNWTDVSSSGFTGYGIKTYSDASHPEVTFRGEYSLRQTAATQDDYPATHNSSTYAWRLQNTAGSLWQATVSTGGVGSFSVWVRRWDNSPDPNYIVEYSTNNGTNWTSILIINNTWLGSSDWKQVSGTINTSNGAGTADDIIIKARYVSGERLMVDDFVMTDYPSQTDTAPFVSDAEPDDGATGIAVDATVRVIFNEAVTFNSTVLIDCSSSGTQNVTPSGGPLNWTLPHSDFQQSETCTITIDAADVSDTDALDPPNNMDLDYSWSFLVTNGADSAPDLFFSEYVEGSSNNKAVEIVNATSNSVNLANYDVQIYSNGSGSAGATITLSGTLAPGAAYLLCNSSASFTGLCSQTSNSLTFNGDDAVMLRHSTSAIDVIGQVGVDPGSAWTWGSLSTVDMTLRRKATVTSGDSLGSDGFLAGLAAQWDGYTTDTFDGLGAHSCSCAEVAPYVIGTLPDTNGTQAAVGANLTVTFQEPVSASASSFSLQCDKSGAHALSVSGGPASFTLDPTADFQSCETCTLTVLKDYVTDLDTSDPPNNMVDNYAFSFTTACACTSIPVIQGTTDSSPCINQTIPTLSGCVTGVTATGFYMQDVAGDGNSATSDGIYVYMYAAWVNGQGIAAGYTATAVNGDVQEFYNATELYNPSAVTKGAACTLPAAVSATQIQTMAAVNVDQYESVEFMRVAMDIDGFVQGPTKRFVSRFAHGDPEIGFIKWGNESSVPTPPAALRGGLRGLRRAELSLRRVQQEPARRGFRRPAPGDGDHRRDGLPLRQVAAHRGRDPEPEPDGDQQHRRDGRRSPLGRRRVEHLHLQCGEHVRQHRRL